MLSNFIAFYNILNILTGYHAQQFQNQTYTCSSCKISLIKISTNATNAEMDADTRPRGYKIFFMLNSVEHDFFAAHKC